MFHLRLPDGFILDSFENPHVIYDYHPNEGIAILQISEKEEAYAYFNEFSSHDPNIHILELPKDQNIIDRIYHFPGNLIAIHDAYHHRGNAKIKIADIQYIAFNGYYINKDDGEALHAHTKETLMLYEKGLEKHDVRKNNHDIFNGVCFSNDGIALAEWDIDGAITYFAITA